MDNTTTAPAATLPALDEPVAPRWVSWVLSVILLGLPGWLITRSAIWEYHLDQATTQLRQRDFDKALHHLSWCRWARSSDPEGWLLSARTARRAERYPDAEAWLATAQKKGARDHDLQLEKTLTLAQKGHTDELEDLLQSALANTRSDYAVIAEVLSAEQMRTYRFQDALVVLDRWIELAADDPEPWLRRAWVKEHQLGFDSAVEDYNRVLTLQPDRHAVRLQVAEVLLRVNRPTDALPHLEQVVAAEPTNSTAAIALARCLREAGQSDRAVAALDALPESARSQPKVLAERGQILLAKGEPAAAEPVLRQALVTSPRDRTLLYNLQQALAQTGRTAEAREVEKTLKTVDLDGRRMNELMSQFNRSPGDPALRYEMATIFLRNGLAEDGLRWLHMTIEVEPMHQEAFEALADYHAKHGPADRAALYRTAATKIAQMKAEKKATP